MQCKSSGKAFIEISCRERRGGTSCNAKLKCVGRGRICVLYIYTFEATERGPQPLDNNKSYDKFNVWLKIDCSNQVPPLCGSYHACEVKLGHVCLPKKNEHSTPTVGPSPSPSYNKTFQFGRSRPPFKFSEINLNNYYTSP